jgi:gamma-glutamyltranspeptidase
MIRERPPLRESATGRAAVSSAHPVATAAGLEMLRRGGNVVDAAVAVSFALGVVEPDASGIGGYGQMLVLTRGMREPVVIDFMARAPEEATLSNAALLRNGRLPDDGPVLAIVPGTVAAMHLAWRQHGSGRLPWAELLAPAIRAARDGYVVSEGLATTLTTEREHFSKYEGSRKLFFPTGEPLRAGETLRNADLAWTLEQIAGGGADAFYKGEVGRRMVADLRGQGNPMTRTDLIATTRPNAQRSPRPIVGIPSTRARPRSRAGRRSPRSSTSWSASPRRAHTPTMPPRCTRWRVRGSWCPPRADGSRIPGCGR